MDYRLYRPDDFAQLYATEEVCFQPPQRFSRNYMRLLTGQANGATWIAEQDGDIRGFGIVEWDEGPDGVFAYVQTLEVLPEWRGMGAGRELLLRLEESARAAGAAAMWLHVDAENAEAIRLYERMGYELAGHEPHYYGRNRTGMVYAKRLGIDGRAPSSIS